MMATVLWPHVAPRPRGLLFHDKRPADVHCVTPSAKRPESCAAFVMSMPPFAIDAKARDVAGEQAGEIERKAGAV